jgi:flagellar biosynthesis GTPase FlhF
MPTLEERINENQRRIKAAIAEETARVKAEKRAVEETAAAERKARREAAMAAEEAAIAEEVRRKAQSEANKAAYRAKVEAEEKAEANRRENQRRRNKEKEAASAAASASATASASAAEKSIEQMLNNAVKAMSSSPKAVKERIEHEVNDIIRINTTIIGKQILSRNIKGNTLIAPGAFIDVIQNILYIQLYLLHMKRNYSFIDDTYIRDKFDNLKKVINKAIDTLKTKYLPYNFDELMEYPVQGKKQPLPFYYNHAMNGFPLADISYDKLIDFSKKLKVLTKHIDSKLKGGRRTAKQVSRRRNFQSRRSRA